MMCDWCRCSLATSPSFRGRLSAIVVGAAVVLSRWTVAQSPDKIDFARDVQPLLRANCYGCHGASLQNGNFRVDRRRDSMPNRVGANGARVVPGNSAASRLYIRISSNQTGVQMPPTGALQPDEIRTIKTWIHPGAEWPAERAGETPSRPQDPVATEMLDAIRRADRGSIGRVLKRHPNAARAAGAGGITALMYAALYRDTSSARLLLDMGADPNARNDAGVSALMWAVDDGETTRLLLERGADPNVRSADGRTPLLLAAARFGAIDIVNALLDRGATPKGQAVLAQATAVGDASVARLLVARGADTSTLPNDLAMRSGCADCIALLLQSADRMALTRALESAARFGDSAGMRMLLDRGAEPTAAALRAAAASERIPLEGVTVLLERGVRDPQALPLASRQGETAIVTALRRASSKDDGLVPAGTPSRPPAPDREELG